MKKKKTTKHKLHNPWYNYRSLTMRLKINFFFICGRRNLLTHLLFTEQRDGPNRKRGSGGGEVSEKKVSRANKVVAFSHIELINKSTTARCVLDINRQSVATFWCVTSTIFAFILLNQNHYLQMVSVISRRYLWVRRRRRWCSLMVLPCGSTIQMH